MMSERKSLGEVNQSVETQNKKGVFKKLLAFMGPAYLVSVGYMDPGNWATDIAGGSRYGYALIWVLLMSNVMAILLQTLSARLGLVAGLDLAQASRRLYNRPVGFMLYLLAELAIIATDLAEVIGMAIGLNLLFGLPLIWGVAVSVLDTFLLLFLMNYGIKKLEAFVLSLIFIIGASFFIEMVVVKPELAAVAKGFIPSIPDSQALYIAIGIIGATVMPHNLYLHSSLVQTRRFARTPVEIIRAIRYNLVDTVISLNLAFLVNSAILILAAAAFYNNNILDVTEIQDAYKFLEPITGTTLAPVLFAVALIAAGQSSTVTGTLAGQIVMEGYLQLRIQPWVRRIVTRVLAVVPAFLVIWIKGENSTGELLILSQVVLSLQLGFAVIPLIHAVSDKNVMGEFRVKLATRLTAWFFAAIIITLNLKMVLELTWTMLNDPDEAFLAKTALLFSVAGAIMLLLYITLKPLLSAQKHKKEAGLHPPAKTLYIEEKQYKRVAIALDFSDKDNLAINQALQTGGKAAVYCLIHVVETVGAQVFGSEIVDRETSEDEEQLRRYTNELQQKGYQVKMELAYGQPVTAIAEKVKEFDADLLVMAAHGHSGIKDWIFGTTVNKLRHRVNIPVFIMR